MCSCKRVCTCNTEANILQETTCNCMSNSIIVSWNMIMYEGANSGCICIHCCVCCQEFNTICITIQPCTRVILSISEHWCGCETSCEKEVIAQLRCQDPYNAKSTLGGKRKSIYSCTHTWPQLSLSISTTTDETLQLKTCVHLWNIVCISFSLSLYIYVYIYIYIHVFTYPYTHPYIYIYVYTYGYLPTNIP